MSRPQQVARPIVRSLRQATGSTATCPSRLLALRPFSSTPSRKDETTTTTTTTPSTPATPGPGDQTPADDAALLAQKKPNLFSSVIKQGSEDELAQLLSPQLGSRRRRAALATTGNVPFEQMPYQCFQEARKILAQDREEKVAKIAAETAKIKRLELADASTFRSGEAYKQKRLESYRDYVESLKILADINDPLVKRRFEDGQGDMNKPIYRYLAHRKWTAMERKIILQRIEQFHIVPDLLPKFEPVVDVKMTFRGYKVAPGAILDSRITETAPTLRMQVFDKGERLFSVVVMDSDVPDPETDSFQKRLHFLATNIPWDPTRTSLPLTKVGGDPATSSPELGALAVPWLPAFSQAGAPYHRLSIFVLQHNNDTQLDAAKLKELYDADGRQGFSLKSFRDKFGLTPVGFNMFRTVWDENTADVMARHGIPGADVEFKHQRVVSLKPPRKARGWEAKRQGPKFRHLWKYTKRIKGLKY